MKRQIICMKCNKEYWNLFNLIGDEATAAGEHIKNIKGMALREYLCDFCGTTIKQSEKCTANSIWSDRGGIPYFEWENEFISIEEE